MTLGYIWLAIAVGFMLLEAFGMPGIGMMFAGLGALTSGLGVLSTLVAQDSYAVQLIIFFTSSLLWALLLWKPLQNMRVGKPEAEYRNIVGDVAYVGTGGVTRERGGEVTWSGTIMRAELSKDTPVNEVLAGTQVVITAVHGATLVVTPKI
jgi:membrane protein implicated in regulation of membrane protease activity